MSTSLVSIQLSCYFTSISYVESQIDFPKFKGVCVLLDVKPR